MSLYHFVEKWRRIIDEQGVDVAPYMIGDFALSAISLIPHVGRLGRNIYDMEWDCLLILDACRYDLYRDTIGESDHIWSRGSSSQEWMANNFTSEYRDEIENTAYITGNIFSRDYCRDKGFGMLDEMWKYEWDDEDGTIHPQPLTDRAITVGREHDFERMIVHYMQPHFPFVGGDYNIGRMDKETFGVDGELDDENIWSQIMFGQVQDIDEVRDAYRKNLEYVWESAEVLMENFDGQVAVSADHGNGMGEWGVWGHRVGFQTPQLRRVPWDVYQCEDKRSHEPDEISREDTSKQSVDERLRDLGYK